MYSPKINESLVPKLYRIAQARHIRMTTLVNGIILAAIKDIRVKKKFASSGNKETTFVIVQ